MGCFAPTKVATPTFTTMATTTTTAPNTQAAPDLTATFTTTNSCEVCKTLDRPCPLYTKPAPPSSPAHSDWSDENWDGEGERRKKEQVEKEKADREKQDSAQKDPKYYLPSPIYVSSYSTVAPALSDSLLLAPEEEEKKWKRNNMK